jgi:hypothetical protein
VALRRISGLRNSVETDEAMSASRMLKSGKTKPRGKDQRLLSFFDVDARAELRSVPFSAIWFPPRVGEQIDLRADVEHGGGLYLIVGVRHVLEDSGPVGQQSAAVVGVVVDVKPQHATGTEAGTAAVDLALDKIVEVPVLPLPITVELPTPETEE